MKPIRSTRECSRWTTALIVLAAFFLVARLITAETGSQRVIKSPSDEISVGMHTKQVIDVAGQCDIAVTCDGSYKQSWHYALPSDDSTYCSVHFGRLPFTVVKIDTSSLRDILILSEQSK